MWRVNLLLFILMRIKRGFSIILWIQVNRKFALNLIVLRTILLYFRNIFEASQFLNQYFMRGAFLRRRWCHFRLFFYIIIIKFMLKTTISLIKIFNSFNKRNTRWLCMRWLHLFIVCILCDVRVRILILCRFILFIF